MAETAPPKNPSRRPRQRGRWRRRVFYLGLIGITVYVFCVHPGKRLLLQYELLMNERAIAASADPPDQVVFDSDVTLAKERVRSGEWQDGWSDTLYNDESTYSLAVRSRSSQLLDRAQQIASEIRRWQELREMPVPSGGGIFGGAFGVGGGTPNATNVFTIRASDYPSLDLKPVVFAQARVATGATNRLVLVRAACDVGLFAAQSGAVTIVGETRPRIGLTDSNLATLHSAVATTPGPAGKVRELVLLPDDPNRGVRIYGGVPDPADESRFSFDYEVNGQRGTIEGRLQADDTIQWAVLSGPAADPHWHEDKLRPVTADE